MELEQFKPPISHGEPYIRLVCNAASSISAGAVAKMDFKPGQKIAFFKDKKRPEDWYFIAIEPGDKSIDGAIIRKAPGDQKNLLFNDSKFARSIRDLFPKLKDQKSFSVKIGEKVEYEGKWYYPLITAAHK